MYMVQINGADGYNRDYVDTFSDTHAKAVSEAMKFTSCLRDEPEVTIICTNLDKANPPKVMECIQHMIKSERKVTAIKLLRNYFNIGLRLAKNLVDEIQAEIHREL